MVYTPKMRQKFSQSTVETDDKHVLCGKIHFYADFYHQLNYIR